MFYKTPIIVFNEYGMNKIEIAKHNTFPLHVKFEIQLRGDMKKKKKQRLDVYNGIAFSYIVYVHQVVKKMMKKVILQILLQNNMTIR